MLAVCLLKHAIDAPEVLRVLVSQFARLSESANLHILITICILLIARQSVLINWLINLQILTPFPGSEKMLSNFAEISFNAEPHSLARVLYVQTPYWECCSV